MTPLKKRDARGVEGLGEMRIIGKKAGLFGNDVIGEEVKVIWRKDDPEEVERAAEVFRRYVLEGWIAFTERNGRKTQIFTFDPDLDEIVIAPIMFGG